MNIPRPVTSIVLFADLKRILLFVPLSFCLLAGSTYSAEVFIGVSTHWAHLKGQDESTGNDLEEPNSKRELGLSLSVKSLDNYFSDSSFGYYLEFGKDDYAVERQVAIGPQILHATLSGNYWFLTPTVFYNFGNKNPESWSLKAGAGLGIGYLSADGTAVIGGPSLVARPIDGNDYDMTVGIMVKYEYRNWVVLLKEYAPNANINGIDFKLELPILTVGYRFDL